MPFTQTMRSLNADQARLPLVVLVVILLLILVWLAWFLLAPVKQYETIAPLQIPLTEIVTTHFPANSIQRIQPGQPAILHLKRTGAQTDANLPAQVVDITVDAESKTQVWLQPKFDNPSFDPTQTYLVSRIDIETSRNSPITLLKQIYN